MVKFCHIAPTKLIPDYALHNGCFLTLAHLVESDPDYVENHLNCHYYHRTDMPKILDNSAFEMYKQKKPMFPAEKLVELGKTIKADYIVMSDYPNEPWQKTKEAAEVLAPVFRKAGFGTFYCPQAPIGKVSDLLKSFEWAAKSSLIDYIGVSILAIPNAFDVEKGNRLQRYLSRWAFMKILRDTSILYHIKGTKKKIHFLGMTDGPREIELCKDYLEFIDTWDSSSAIWHGYNHISFDSSPTGLKNGKLETEVDFNVELPDGERDTKIFFNIQYINGLIKRFGDDV